MKGWRGSGWVLALSLLGSSLCWAAPKESPVLKEGMSLQRAYKAIVAQGWRPNPGAFSRGSGMSGLQKKLFVRGFTAVEDCAVDQPLCNFKFKKNGQCLQITSEGEAIRELKLYHWTHDCEPDS